MSVLPLRDLGVLRLARKRDGGTRLRLAPFILPTMAVILFGLLFIWANPVIEEFAALVR